MSSVLVIDARSRGLQCFVASATVAGADRPNQLVLRHALDMNDLGSILGTWEEEYCGFGHSKRVKRFRSELPIIVMGRYEAKSSAGHAVVRADDSHRKVVVVGGLGEPFGKGGLRPLGLPIAGTLIQGPVVVEELAGSGNSNVASAVAAWEGVKILSQTDQKSVFLVEGQSDYTKVYRLRPDENAPATELPVEHRDEMFSRENIIRQAALAAARHFYRGISQRTGAPKPSEENLREEARRELEYYLSTEGKGTDRLSKTLGLVGGSVSYVEVRDVAERLGTPEAATTAAAEDFVEIVEDDPF